MIVGVLLLAGAVALASGLFAGRRHPRAWLAATATGCGFLAGAAASILGGGEAWEWRSSFSVGGDPLHLSLDGISALFLALLAVIGALGAFYSKAYWSEEQQPESAPRGRVWWCGMIASIAFVLLASNGLHFLIGWEIFAVCSYFLITLDHAKTEVRAAGWLYLAASHAGTLCLFAFFTLLAGRTGTWDLGPLAGRADFAPLFWLALAGFAVKAGLFPVHVWLPSAHANAPSHVSALMSGVTIKMGIYGILRFSGWLPVPAQAGWLLVLLGGGSAVLGIAFAFVQNDLKRLLAYCSVENIGLITLGLGGALLGAQHGNAPWGRLLLTGALFHVWNHGLYKSLLFFGAGSVLHATGTRELSRLGGLWKSMPWTALLFGLGAAAIAGLPPFNGFVSEWLLYLGLFDTITSRSAGAWVALPAVLLMATAGALALASFVKAGSMIFLGAPRTEAARHAHECPALMKRPMIGLAVICLALGLAPWLVWPAISRAVGTWNPAWVQQEPPAPLVALGLVHVALAVCLALAGLWLWRRVTTLGLRRGLTWDCGYAEPTARMQYTGGSFSAIVEGWFRWILYPERTQHRPHGAFPGPSSRVERVPETVLERVLEPVAAGVLRVSSAARRLQHGRLQFYLLYLVAGMAALGILALWEELQ